MIGPLKDAPDWMMGTAIAVCIWAGAVHVVLTERAMSADMDHTVLPQCVAQLEQEQDRALTRASEDAGTRRAEIVDDLRRLIRSKRAQLREAEDAIAQYRYLKGTYDETGLSAFVPLPKVSLPTDQELAALRTEINEAETRLSDLPDLVLPRLPSSELAKTCTCAAAQAMAGVRFDYTLSLASFRLFEPEDIQNAKTEVSTITNWSGCGGKPWKDLT